MRTLPIDTKCTHCDAGISGMAVEVDNADTKWKCPDCEGWNYFSDEDKAFNIIERKQCADQTHPLLNPESKHYSMVDGIEAICHMEQLYTTEELMVWAKITAMKYRLRIGNKDDVLKEAKKIETYEAYYKYLEDKLKHEEIK